MKHALSILLLIGLISPAWAVLETKPFADYQVILDRQPFGTPPEVAPEPERVIPASESFAAQMVLSGIYELDDGNLRAAITDKKDNSYFSLMIGETDANGIELIDVDYDKEEVVLKKGDEVVVLSMNGNAGTQVLNTTERKDREEKAKARRLSYAERRRARQLARQKPVEIPKPVYSGAELEKHLQEYQMEVIREGLPPLPVQLTPDRDAQLVAEGFLPPVDEEGYEIEPEEEYYYEDEGY
jgi:hypothetical protein